MALTACAADSLYAWQTAQSKLYTVYRVTEHLDYNWLLTWPLSVQKLDGSKLHILSHRGSFGQACHRQQQNQADMDKTSSNSMQAICRRINAPSSRHQSIEMTGELTGTACCFDKLSEC